VRLPNAGMHPPRHNRAEPAPPRRFSETPIDALLSFRLEYSHARRKKRSAHELPEPCYSAAGAEKPSVRRRNRHAIPRDIKPVGVCGAARSNSDKISALGLVGAYASGLPLKVGFRQGSLPSAAHSSNPSPVMASTRTGSIPNQGPLPLHTASGYSNGLRTSAMAGCVRRIIRCG
jgi:hypothetical protein